MSFTVLALTGPYSSTCGYCAEQPGSRSSSNSSHSYGAYPAYLLPCSVYHDMLDHGWRRSGVFLYKPDMKRTCCPQYTIRLDALEFSPSRSQRQVTNRFNRYILDGDKQEHAASMDVEDVKYQCYTCLLGNNFTGLTRSRKKGKPTNSAFNLVNAIHSSESSFVSDVSKPAHRFEVTNLDLTPCSRFTAEKFSLYKAYQRDIHKEKEEKTSKGFKRFLIDSPLLDAPIPYPTPPPAHLPKTYGSYHQCYRIDGELFAMAVLDILPGCVSSVYFMYNKKWERFSPGKVSALREAALTREIHDAGVPLMRFLYMGFYVFSCSKMRYKGDFAPSYLLDPEEYSWFLLEKCKSTLEKHRYACFSRPENSLDDDPGPEEGEPRVHSILISLKTYMDQLRTSLLMYSRILTSWRKVEMI
ncbi:hypothetical protein K439DRAFT_1504475 [Ramaria rubella]|nr:hypothetical protein K439DRAFT_1504475 [Ramaria rubella]